MHYFLASSRCRSRSRWRMSRDREPRAHPTPRQAFYAPLFRNTASAPRAARAALPAHVPPLCPQSRGRGDTTRSVLRRVIGVLVRRRARRRERGHVSQLARPGEVLREDEARFMDRAAIRVIRVTEELLFGPARASESGVIAEETCCSHVACRHLGGCLSRRGRAPVRGATGPPVDGLPAPAARAAGGAPDEGPLALDAVVTAWPASPGRSAIAVPDQHIMAGIAPPATRIDRNVTRVFPPPDLVAKHNGRAQSRQSRTKRAAPDPDAEIVALLAEDGRRSNRDIARGTGIPERDVAARVHQTVRRGPDEVIAVADVFGAGFQLMLWMGIEVSGRPPAEVRGASWPGSPRCSLSCSWAGSRHRNHPGGARPGVPATVDFRISSGRVAGIRRLAASLRLEVFKFRSGLGPIVT